MQANLWGGFWSVRAPTTPTICPPLAYQDGISAGGCRGRRRSGVCICCMYIWVSFYTFVCVCVCIPGYSWVICSCETLNGSFDSSPSRDLLNKDPMVLILIRRPHKQLPRTALTSVDISYPANKYWWACRWCKTNKQKKQYSNPTFAPWFHVYFDDLYHSHTCGLGHLVQTKEKKDALLPLSTWDSFIGQLGRLSSCIITINRPTWRITARRDSFHLSDVNNEELEKNKSEIHTLF